MGTLKKLIVLTTALLAIFTWNRQTAQADSLIAAEMLPPETMALIEITNVNELCEKVKQTSLYGLYKSPEMRPFIEPTEKNLRNKLDELLKELWKELGVEDMPTELPLAQGHVGLAIFVNPKTTQVPDYSQLNSSEMTPEDWDNIDPEALPKRDTQEPDFQVVAWAQMGDKLDEAKKLAKIIEAKTVEEGSLRQRETIRGVQINILKQKPDSDVNFDTFCYGFKEDMLIVGSSLNYIREFIVRLGQTERPTLAQNSSYQAASRKLGQANLKFYLNGPALINLIREFAANDQKEKTTQVIETLGLSNLGGIGYNIQVAPTPNEDFRITALLGVQGEKKGIPALLSPITQPVHLNRLITKNTASFFLAHYDLGKVYDQILQMMMRISGFNPTPMLDSMLAMTGDPATGHPPVNLRNDVLGQLSTSCSFVSRVEKPYQSAESIKMLLALGVRDAQILDNTLQRIHSTFIAKGDKELQRELLGSRIYVLPGSEFFLSAILASQGAEIDDQSRLQMALTIAGDQLVLGSIAQVEQSIRDLQRESLEGMKTDPMYQHVAHYLPERAGIVYYENTQRTTERSWWLIKEAARKAALEPDSNSIATTDDAEAFGYAFGLDLASGKDPMQVLVKTLSDYINFSALPDYASIKKYFGAGIGYVTDSPEGIYAYLTSVKPPTQAK